MLPVSTKELIRFVPAAFAGADAPPTYLLAVPTLAGRAEFRRRMAQAGAANPAAEELRAKLIEGVHAVVAEDQRAELLAVIDAAAGAAPTRDQLERLADVERQIRPFHPPLANLQAERAFYLELLPLVCCQLFLRGAENVPAPIPLANGPVADDALGALEPGHLAEAGWRAFELMFLPRGLEKNSEPRSPSGSGPATSAAAAPPRTRRSGGASSARSTKKTPASS